jgi:hypothetical protein
VPGPREPLSPELALVHSELAERARAGLPERPWEAFSAARRTGPRAADERGAHESNAAGGTRRQSRRRFRPGFAVGIAVGIGVLLAFATLSVPDAPTLAPGPAPDASGRAGVKSVSRPSRTATPELARKPRPTRSQPEKRSQKHAAQRPPQSPTGRTVRVPSGLFVFHIGGRAAHLQIGDGGRAIIELRTESGCLRQLVLGNIPIGRDGSFRYRIAAGGRRQATVSLAGRFTSEQTVRGTIRTTHVGCDSGPVRFSAQLA